MGSSHDGLTESTALAVARLAFEGRLKLMSPAWLLAIALHWLLALLSAFALITPLLFGATSLPLAVEP